MENKQEIIYFLEKHNLLVACTAIGFAIGLILENIKEEKTNVIYILEDGGK